MQPTTQVVCYKKQDALVTEVKVEKASIKITDSKKKSDFRREIEAKKIDPASENFKTMFDMLLHAQKVYKEKTGKGKGKSTTTNTASNEPTLHISTPKAEKKTIKMKVTCNAAKMKVQSEKEGTFVITLNKDAYTLSKQHPQVFTDLQKQCLASISAVRTTKKS